MKFFQLTSISCSDSSLAGLVGFFDEPLNDFLDVNCLQSRAGYDHPRIIDNVFQVEF